MADQIKALLAQKQAEMRKLQDELENLDQIRLEGLYPGRCFQYCIDHALATRAELGGLTSPAIQQRAETHHFNEVAAAMIWPCDSVDCEGWNGRDPTCGCERKHYYWMYETLLSLNDTTINQSPAASNVDE